MLESAWKIAWREFHTPVFACGDWENRPDRDPHRVPIEYKLEETSYLRHFSVVNKLLRFVYLNICGVSMLSE